MAGHSTSVRGEYARSHSGKDYTARCHEPDCGFSYSGGGNPMAEQSVYNAARRHTAETDPNVMNRSREDRAAGRVPSHNEGE